MNFNWLDCVITIILVINILYGLRRGLVRTLFGMLGLLIALFLCLKGTPAVAELLIWLRIYGVVAYIAALILLFIIIYFLVNEIGRHVQALVKNSAVGHLDLLGGFVCGLVKGIIYTLFLLTPLMGNIFASPALHKAFVESALLTIGHPLIYYAEPLIQGVIRQGNQTWQEYRKDFEQYNIVIDPMHEVLKDTASELPKSISYY